MPHKPRLKTKTKVMATANAGSLTGLLILYAMESGISINEIARIADVTRATVHNWVGGSSASDQHLRRLIEGLNLVTNAFDILVPESMKQHHFDPRSLGREVVISEMEAKFEKLKKHSKANAALESRGRYQRVFESNFLKSFGRQLFERAFRDHVSHDELVLITPEPPHASGLPTFLDEYIEDGVISYAGLEELGLDMDGPFRQRTLSLTELCEEYDAFSTAIETHIPEVRLALQSSLDRDPYISICSVDWECYRNPQHYGSHEMDESVPAVDYFFYWLCDVDGRRVINRIFAGLKEAMREKRRELILFMHDGYFRGEFHVYDDEEDEEDGLESTIDEDKEDGLESTITEKGIDASKVIRGFRYREKTFIKAIENDTVQIGDGIEGRKLFFLMSNGLSKVWEALPLEISLEAIKFMFSSLGYKARIQSHPSQKCIHEVLVTW